MTASTKFAKNNSKRVIQQYPYSTYSLLKSNDCENKLANNKHKSKHSDRPILDPMPNSPKRISLI